MNKREMFAAEIAPDVAGSDEIGADGTIGLLAYTGSVVDRFDWYTGERYTMAMDTKPESVDLSLIDAGGSPFLDMHQDGATGDVLGNLLTGTASVGNGEFRVRAKLSVDPEHAGKIANIKAKVLKAVSVGFDILEFKETPATKKKSPNDVQHVLRHVQVTKWRPFEVSLVTRGADPRAQTFSRQEPPIDAPGSAQESKIMDETQLAAARIEGAAAERERLAAIDQAAAVTKAPAELVAKLRADGVSADEARKAILAAAQAAQVAQGVSPQVAILRDAGDTVIEQAKHALLAKAIPANIEAKIDGKVSLLWDGDKAGSLRNGRVVDIVRTMLGATGQLRDGMNDREVVRRALLAHSSSDLPDLLGDSVGKALAYGYQVQEKQYERFCKRVQTPGLHARKPVIVSGASAIGEMAEGAPYPQQTIGDTAESYSAKKYGGQVAITLEALLRDDLDALSQIPTGLSNGLVIKQNAIVAALFASGGGYGPTLAADSVALFNSAHANLVDNGSGGAPTMARFAALRTLLAKMEDAQGNLQPRQLRYIVVPAELFHTAEALLQGQAMPSSLSVESRTPSLSRLEIVPFDYLASATKWFGFADPMLSPVIEVATPNNMPEVWAESEIDFSTDARVVKAGMYFAAAAVDFRGAAMNFGA